MKVILTEDVVGVGDIGDTVKVRPGYARNFLIPRGLAMESATASARVIAHKMKQIEAKKRKLKGEAEELQKKLTSITVKLALRVGTGGKVFGSVSARDIAREITAGGLEIDRRRVLIEEPIKKIGTHHVKVKLHPEVVAEATVIISATEASKDQEAEETKDAKEAIEAGAAEGAADSEGKPEKKRGKRPKKEKEPTIQ